MKNNIIHLKLENLSSFYENMRTAAHFGLGEGGITVTIIDSRLERSFLRRIYFKNRKANHRLDYLIVLDFIT